MKWIISNHKMNLTLPEVEDYVQFLETVSSTKNQLVFCPSFPFLSYFKGKNYALGSQNVADRSMGALTGEVSVEQLTSLGVTYAIVGHSERRNILNENNELIHDKIKICLDNGITPVLCIGEKLEEQDKKMDILKEEIKTAFEGLAHPEKVIIAYEPIWAIGTGKIPTSLEIETTINEIKNEIKENYHTECPVLYGGSVNEKNIEELKQISCIDGYLIGGTSLKKDSIRQVIEMLEV